MAELKKIREEVARLFEISLIPLAVRLGGGPLKSGDDEGKDSYWCDYSSSAVNNIFFHNLSIHLSNNYTNNFLLFFYIYIHDLK